MLLNCARNARCVNGGLFRQLAVLTVHADRGQWRRLASSAATQRMPSSSDGEPGSALPPGFMKMSDILDVVFAPLMSFSTPIPPPAVPKNTRDAIERDAKNFMQLTTRLRHFQLPSFSNDGEALVKKSMVEANAALLSEIKPLILPLLPRVSVVARFRLLDVMAARNIRDEELLNALYDSIIAQKGKYPIIALSHLADKYAKLGIHHTGVLDRLVAGLLNVMQNKSEDRYEIVRTIMSLGKIRVGSARLWMNFGEWARSNFSVLPFLSQLDLLNAFAMVSAPLLMNLWPYVTKALSKDSHDPNFMLTQTYNSVVAGVIDLKLLAQVLHSGNAKLFQKQYNKMAFGESATNMYNVLRQWHLSASAYFLDGTPATASYIKTCKLFNEFVKAKEEREQLLWQVKYSRDMSSVERFRSLLHDVAPLGTHSTAHHIHPERGVCVEANIAVCDGKLVSLAEVVDLKKAGKQITVVSVLYFMRKHTTLPESTSNDELRYRLDGKSRLSVRLMMAPAREGTLPKTHPVVFTEHDFDVMKDDESKRAFIRDQIEGLSGRFHKLNWPTARKGGKNRRSSVS